MSTASSQPPTEVQRHKRSLRQDMRARLRAYTPTDLQRESEMVWDRLHALPVYQSARSIGLFLSMPSGEINTDPAMAEAYRRGKTVYVPRVGADCEQADMDMIRVETTTTKDSNDAGTTAPSPQQQPQLPHHAWPKNRWNIPEPPSNAQWPIARPGDIDLLIVPGLAFDRHGHRLGQGKGYYDRFIARLQPPPTLVAVGLACQLQDAVIPTHEHDMRMDMVLVPEETVHVVKEPQESLSSSHRGT